MLGRTAARALSETLTLGDEHRYELAATCYQGFEVEALGVDGRVQEARQVVPAGENGGELGEEARIEAVGLGEGAHRLREVARLTWVDDRHGEAGGREHAGELGLIATARLHQHESGLERRERRCQDALALAVVREAILRQCRTQHSDIDARFGDIDADDHHGSLGHGLRTPSLSMRAHRADGPGNRPGWAKTSAGSVRDLLTHGLSRPRRPQAARSGPVATMAPRLYRPDLG
jgi:hypothetical protein